jgi:RNA polymerase sigma-70 factor, ECF subfamily
VATRDVQPGPQRAAQPGDAAFEDRWLVLSFQAGDEASYRLIHERYRSQVESLCRRLLGNYHDAEEATQETFLRVYKALPRFNGQYRLRPWILRIATNVSLDILRARARQRENHTGASGENVIRLDRARLAQNLSGKSHSNGGGHSNGEAEDPFEIVDRRQQDDQVRRVLGSLPEHYRTALVLREFEGLSYDEIGAALGESPAKVKALLHRAKKRFRKMWDRAGQSLGLIPFPLVTWIRRLTNSATEISAPLAGPPASLAGVVAASGATPLFSATAERVVATVAAVAVTGAVGLGVAKGVGRDRAAPEPKPAPVVSQAPPQEPVVAPPAQRTVVVPPAGEDKLTGDAPVVAEPSNPVIPEESIDPTVQPTETAPPSETPGTISPEPTPIVDPTPTEPTPAPPEPPIVTPPPYSAGFTLELGGEQAIFDAAQARDFIGQGSLENVFRFFQEIRGEAKIGETPWTIRLAFEGSISRGSGRVMVFGTMTSPGGSYEISSSSNLVLTSNGVSEEGVWKFGIVESPYTVTTRSGDPSLAPLPGNLQGSMSWFQDGTPVSTNPYLYELEK